MRWMIVVFAVLFCMCAFVGLAEEPVTPSHVFNGELEVKVFAPFDGVKNDASTTYGNFYLDVTAKVDEFNEVLYEFGATGPGTNYTVDEVYIQTNMGKYAGWEKLGLTTRIGHVNLKSKDFSLMTDYAYEKDSTRDGYKSGGFLLKPSYGKFYGQYGFASYKGVMIDEALIGIKGLGPLQYFEISHSSFDPSIFFGAHFKVGKDKYTAQLLGAYKHWFNELELENFYGLSTKLTAGKAWAAAAIGGNNVVFPALASGEIAFDNAKYGAMLEGSWGEDTGWRTAELYVWKYIGKLKLKPGFKFTPEGNYAVARAVVTW